MAPYPIASTSSSSMVTTPSRPLTPSSDSEFVRALHDFVPSAESTCLAFEAGQVIRTLNKDESGWWDGELDGKRGWFPSNYVEVLLPGWRDSDDSLGGKSNGRDSSESRGSPEPSTSFFAQPSDAEGGVLESIQQAIKLLQNAVQTNRISHFQPSTACVISSVRTVLSSTDCLTRESKVLKRHPSLVSERKRILGSLSSLVNQARRASSPTASIEERVEDTDRMLALATTVQENVLTFLSVAARSGVRLAEVDQGTAGGGANAIFEGEFGNGRAVRNGKQPELRAARSMGDLKSRRPILRVTPHASTMPTSRGPQSAPLREHFPASATSSSSSAASSSIGPLTPGKHQALVLHSTDELLRILSTIHDQLLSTIAAFIGHVHAHTRSSHSASFAHLIDMTRETIEKVREVLVVVEAVSNHPMLLNGRSSDLDVLRGCKEALYVATTALVTAARSATSAPVLNTPQGEDDERRSLLHSATAVLRSGGDCVGAVKLCIAQHNASTTGPFELVLPDLDGPAVGSIGDPKIVSHDYRHPNEIDDAADLDGPDVLAAGERKHTLSMLGRKATSLSCLKEKYEADAGITSVKEEQETDADELEERLKESVANPSRSRTIQGRKGSASSSSCTTSGTVTSTRSSPTQGRPQIHSRTSSRASSRAEPRTVTSVPMSRGESSRTSESATSSRSGLSRTSTNDTSPRSSLNNNDPLKPKVPLTIPIPPRLSNESNLSQSPSTRAPPSSARLSFSSTKESEHWYLSRDYEAQEISFNGDGHVTGGTLRCLIERMTLHDTTIDPAFSNTFFLTFRMFTTPSELANALYERFALVPPTEKPLTPAELKSWTDSKATPIRLRIYNLFKTWIENFWQAETDEVILPALQAFCRERLAVTMANAAQRLIDLIQKRIQTTIAAESANAGRPRATLHRAKSSERLRSGKVVAVGADPYLAPSPTGPPPPAPLVSKALLATLRTGSTHLNILDIDPLELARQLTIMESRLYIKIRADELLGQEFSKKGSSAVNVRAMSTLSTRLTGWIAEIILNEQDAKKRTTLVKYFIKLSDRCLALHNYNALMAILCALNSSTISRLKKTWEGLSTKYRILLDSLRKATEHSRNYAEYRANIRSAVPPCLPFVGLFLTDITFCAEGNPAERASPVEPTLRLINFDRYQKMSRIISDLQRFQVPYNLLEVPEIQFFLRESLEGLRHGGDVTSLYRQSLLVEPRTDFGGYNPRSTELFNWKS